MSDVLSLVRKRLRRQQGMPLSQRLREDAYDLAAAATALVALRSCDVVGLGVRVRGGLPRIDNRGRIEIGERTRLACEFAPVELTAGPGARLAIGAGVALNFGTTISAAKSVVIGDGVAFGPYCIVSDSELPGVAGDEPKPIEIGNDVWLASRVTVLPGSRIGAGAVITAGSVVSGEIPPRVVAGGSPARVLRHLDAPTNGAAAPTNGAATNGQTTRAAAVAAASTVAAPAAKPAAEPAHRGLLISDFTIDELARCLETDTSEPLLAAELAPFGLVLPTLMSPPAQGHDYAVVWTRPESAVPSFAKVMAFEAVDEETLLAEVDAFAQVLENGLRDYRFAFVPTWTSPAWQRGLGFIDTRPNGVTRALMAMNLRLMQRLAHCPNVYVLNAQRWVDAAGRGAHSAKLWYMGKVPFHTTVFEQAALDIKAAVRGLSGMARKLVIVDLDDTLWGGIVGDAGWENLRLGGHDSVGEAFVDFQRSLKALKNRGIVLGIVSKNDESVALEAIRKHPEMVLREDDFVAWRINWQDKARNIADLVSGLNLGLQSAVFIDDNPYERARVREALPEVLVPDWPEDKLAYASALASLRCFDAPAVSREDLARTEMYASERKREALRANVGSIEEWLRGLEIRVRAEPLGAANIARTTQLLNKTNQMNLTTRRMTEPELEAWVKEPHRKLYAIHVSDRLGDSGLTGILSLEKEGDVARIVDFVLSCRVMGRKVEETMAHLAVETARALSASTVLAEYLPTKKNKPCLEFWQRSKFACDDGTHFRWDVREPYALPDVITLEVQG